MSKNNNINNKNNNGLEMESPIISDNPFRRSAVTARTPEQNEEENKVVCNSSEAFTKLGVLITSLMMFVKDRNNVHHVIKEQVRVMKVTYDTAVDELRKKNEKPKQEDKAIQTQPTIAKQVVETVKRGRDQNDEPPKAKKIKRHPPNPSNEVNGDMVNTRAVDLEPSSEWRTVNRKKKKKEKKKDIPKKVRPSAMIISANGENTYADILRKIKADPTLHDFGKNVKKIRRTHKGELLLEINSTNKDETVSFNELVGKTLNGTAEIKTKVSETVIECKDLDEVTTKADICTALEKQLCVSGLDVNMVKNIRKAYGGTQTAKVSLPDAVAQKALKMGKIRIGWTICRVRAPIILKRCFRCLEYGHLATECKSSNDRSNLCLKCGEPNHIAKNCTSDPRCMFCLINKEVDTKHVSGSRRCPVFKKAISLRNR